MIFNANTHCLTLSAHDTRRWGTDEAFRANVRTLLQAYARRHGHAVLLAHETCGGYALEEIA